jgi:DNA processing protein
MADFRHAFRFASIPGVGPKTFHRVRARLAETGNSWADLFDNPEEITGRLDLSPRIVQAVSDPDPEAEMSFRKLQANQISILVAGEENYPDLLIETLGDSAPPLIFAHGNLELLKQPGIAFSGSRKASPEGIDIARELARTLANAATIVSGYAAGIDTTAHLGALQGGGSTIIVLPCGILRNRMNSALADEWDEDRICVISEFMPRQPWRAEFAMRRNRTIVGLSRVVICFEPGPKGGTRETAKLTTRLSRQLYLARYEAAVNWKPVEHLATRGGNIINFTSPSEERDEDVTSRDLFSAATEKIIAAFNDFRPPPRQGNLF